MSKKRHVFPGLGLPQSLWLCPWSSVIPEGLGASLSTGAGPLSQKLPRIWTEACGEPSLTASIISLCLRLLGRAPTPSGKTSTPRPRSCIPS